MADFKVSEATQEGKTWKAVGINPETGKRMTIQGGQEGVEVGKKIQKVINLLTLAMMQRA